MSADLDALAESARNRGLKLVRSRVRTSGKVGFGKVGLSDAAGRAVFGMNAKIPTATAEDVEEYLRSLGLSDWSASLGVKEKPRRRKKPEPEAEPLPEQLSEPEPVPEREPKTRNAVPSDAEALVPLIALLDHDVEATGVRERLRLLAGAGEVPLVALLGDTVVGLCGLHRMIVVHRPAPVGRITILVVAEAARGRGIGRLLVERAEAHLRGSGCALVEITSNDRLTQAHAFYRHLGYERTSMRFARTLG
ncbi:MAG: GNAT family N-acetyltransferase [Sphingomicrobium sp.]|nr:GNAT family N-acetyltransferase [Sphingomonadales bacterium]